MNQSMGCHGNGENSNFITTLKTYNSYIMSYNQNIIIIINAALSDIFPAERDVFSEENIESN